jgi:hypothetical protein
MLLLGEAGKVDESMSELTKAEALKSEKQEKEVSSKTLSVHSKRKAILTIDVPAHFSANSKYSPKPLELLATKNFACAIFVEHTFPCSTPTDVWPTISVARCISATCNSAKTSKNGASGVLWKELGQTGNHSHLAAPMGQRTTRIGHLVPMGRGARIRGMIIVGTTVTAAIAIGIAPKGGTMTDATIGDMMMVGNVMEDVMTIGTEERTTSETSSEEVSFFILPIVFPRSVR